MKNLSVRDIPDEVHASLATKAAAAGQSLQQFLLQEFERIAGTVTNAEANARLAAEAASMRAVGDIPMLPNQLIIEGPAARARRRFRERTDRS